MAQEDVKQIVEAAYSALNGRDIEGFLALAHPDVEFRSLIAEMDDIAYRGHDGVREWWRSVAGALPGVRFEPQEITALGDVGITRLRVVATVDGVDVPQVMWQTWRVEDGRVVWWALFRTEPEAREALGLAE